jgi:hypothetical protein
MPSKAASDEPFTLHAECIRETKLAWCVEVWPMGAKGTEEMWLPKSICDRMGLSVFEIPVWLAEKHRLT